MAWTKAQTGVHATTAGGSSVSIVFASNPTKGNVVCVAVWDQSGVGSALTVSDANGKAYTISPSSPSVGGSVIWPLSMFYLIVPAGASKTITATRGSGSTAISMWADEFTPPANTIALFDTDIAGGSTTASSPVTTPSITPAGAGCLLYSAVSNPPTTNINGVGGSWVENDAGFGGNGDAAAYILNSSAGATTANFTFPGGGSQALNTLIMSFKTVSAVTLVQVVAGANNSGATFATATFGSNNAAGNVIVVGVFMTPIAGTVSVSSVTDTAGNTYTKNVATATQAGTHYSNLYTEFEYVGSCLPGVGNVVTVTFSASVTAEIVIYELTPALFDQSSIGTNALTNTPTPANITTGTAGSYGIAIGVIDNGFGLGSGWFTAGSGWTLGLEFGGGNSNQVAEHQAQVSAGVLAANIGTNFPAVTGPNAGSMITFSFPIHVSQDIVTEENRWKITA